MNTFNQPLANITMLILVGMFTLSVSAQVDVEGETDLIYLDTVSVVANQQAYKKMVSKIVLNENFKYRKALKRSKATKQVYAYSDTSVSETVILKHFKKAARRSESVDEFISYFYDRELPFLTPLDSNIIASLYDTIRQTTLNGYLDDLESMVGSGY